MSAAVVKFAAAVEAVVVVVVVGGGVASAAAAATTATATTHSGYAIVTALIRMTHLRCCDGGLQDVSLSRSTWKPLLSCGGTCQVTPSSVTNPIYKCEILSLSIVRDLQTLGMSASRDPPYPHPASFIPYPNPKAPPNPKPPQWSLSSLRVPKYVAATKLENMRNGVCGGGFSAVLGSRVAGFSGVLHWTGQALRDAESNKRQQHKSASNSQQ